APSSFSSLRASAAQVARIGDGTRKRGRHGGGGAREDRPRARALTPLEVAVAGADRELAGRHRVAVHPEAHRAAGLAPFAAGRANDLVEALGLGFPFHLIRARHD